MCVGGDTGGTRACLVAALVGFAVLGLTGFFGGGLLTEWGIGVEGTTR